MPMRINEKLVETKQAWARQGRLIGGEAPSPSAGKRLPPGQHLTRDWPVLDLGVQPDIRLEEWSLGVAGLVDNPLTWDWQAFNDLPQVESTSDIHCVTSWSRFDNRWRGVAARTLLEAVKPRPEARFLIFHGFDGYTTNVPLAHFDADDALLAHSWQGKPLDSRHGGPVRVVIPRLYFWKSAKWVRQVTFVDRDAPGFWEVRGYHDVGDPWKEERYG